jgi:predicted ribosome quality control (RQC) complex YloA/Tae2 family protein
LDDQTIRAIVEEVAPVLVGRSLGKVFQLSDFAVAIGFRPSDGRYLFVGAAPVDPRIYLIERRPRELEKQSIVSSPFLQVLRKHLGGAKLLAMVKDERDRIVRFAFAAEDDTGGIASSSLIAQLTGRAANLLLLDSAGRVVERLRPLRGLGQEIWDVYAPPAVPAFASASSVAPDRGSFATFSEAADDFYQRLAANHLFEARAAQARELVRKAVTQREKLYKHLTADLATHGDAEEHKRMGDLLLANIGSAVREGNTVILTDYYSEDARQVTLEIDEKKTLQQEASGRFARYQKAKRAAQEIRRRLPPLQTELEDLRRRLSEIEGIVQAHDEVALEEFLGASRKEAPKSTGREKPPERIPGTRRYRSSDGYEILVGRGARHNDHLTFRVARPHDLWLHAADYPGSHVIIRSRGRNPMPQRAIIEAAQLAAYFSQARSDSKVDVHYAARKFLSKPKGAAPGLVRMSHFRTMTVEPAERIARIP